MAGGIAIFSGSNNIISYNEVKYNGVGISTELSDNIVVKYNNIIDNYVGVHNFVIRNKVEIINNNIYSNRGKDCFHNYIHPSPKVNVNNNYWGRPMIFPKVIPGLKYIYLFTIKWPIGMDEYMYIPIFIPTFTIDFDRNPASEPYDI
jgi:parallel beta-helix repeat protein